MTQPMPQQLSVRGRWIPWIFVGGFLVVIAVNATLIAFASQTFSGLVVAHPYRKGQEYSQTKSRLTDQASLGWQFVPRLTAGLNGRVTITLDARDAAGSPLGGLNLQAGLERPVENMPPQPLSFREIAGGTYVAELALPKSGLWDLRLLARRGNEEFDFAERLRAP